MKRTSRRPSTLSKSVQHRLNWYALAASAAGVTALALTQPAEAKIIYTRANKLIGPHHSLTIDLNHDGIADFKFSNRFSCGDECHTLLSVTGNGIVAYQSSASALASGIRIGPHKRFSPQAFPEFIVSGSVFFPGDWVKASTEIVSAYLGLRFQIRGQAHYGWARMELTVLQPNRNQAEILGRITGYAYETIPNKPIIAGKTHGNDVITVQPASLGALAAGAVTKASQ